MHESSFRQWISAAPGARFAPEPDRYHLYVMRGCPWAHRTLIARKLKGLEGVIGMTAVHQHLVEGVGWTFSPDRPDPLYGAARLRELYEMASPGYDGRVTVPVLWDKQERTIVNNESADIVRMFAIEFDDLASEPGADLYPVRLRPEIDRWNAWIQPALNEGAYAAGFAADQKAYDSAAIAFFEALDELEAHLSTQRFLAGGQPTEADWRLFPTLIRFEWVYHGLFKLDRRRLVDYPNLFGYVRDLYQWPGIADTVSEHDIRHGYWPSMIRLNPGGIVPIGPAVDFTQPHGRHRLTARRVSAA